MNVQMVIIIIVIIMVMIITIILDVHKNVLTLLDHIIVPAGMVTS